MLFLNKLFHIFFSNVLVKLDILKFLKKNFTKFLESSLKFLNIFLKVLWVLLKCLILLNSKILKLNATSLCVYIS